MEDRGSSANGQNGKAPGFPKGTFGYKMSKKVAELTQVVHMLFTRNHEREVEIDELRDCYEQEIANIIKDAKNRIEKLEYQIRDGERKRKRETDKVAGNTAQLLREAQERMEVMKNEILDEKKENTQLRDLLTQAHKDLEILKHGSSGVSGDLEKKNRLLEEREKEFQKLWQSYSDLEAKSKANHKYTDEIKKQLELSQDASHKSRHQMEKILKIAEEKSRRCEELQRKIKIQDDELKYLKRELNKKNKEIIKDKAYDRRPDTSSKEKSNNHDQGRLWREEVDRLRREIEWLRNELRNREGNFNRVFANFQPVFVGGSSVMRTQQDILQERDMMMVTPTSSLAPVANFNRNALMSSPSGIGGSSRRRTPNLTGLEPRVQSMVPTPTPVRPVTKRGVRMKDVQSLDENPVANFRLIYTK